MNKLQLFHHLHFRHWCFLVQCPFDFPLQVSMLVLQLLLISRCQNHRLSRFQGSNNLLDDHPSLFLSFLYQFISFFLILTVFSISEWFYLLIHSWFFDSNRFLSQFKWFYPQIHSFLLKAAHLSFLIVWYSMFWLLIVRKSFSFFFFWLLPAICIFTFSL